MPEPEPTQIALPVAFVGVDEAPLYYANQFVFQATADGECFLVIGETTPPILLGSPAEQLEQAQRIPFLPVRTIARVGIPPHTARALVEIMQAQLEKLSTMMQETPEEAPE